MASNIDVIYGTLQPLEQEFQAVCSEPTIAFKREMEFAMQVFSGNEYLAKVAAGNPLSTRSAVMNVSAIGITLNPAQKLAYLVPRKGKICLDISYMGLMHIAQQSGAIKWCQSAIVRKNDKFKRVGIDRAPEHEFNEFATAEERGEMVGVYCVVKTDDGDYLTNTMRIADVYAIRDRSEAYKSGKPSPWSTDEEQMILKTVVKQAAKYWPRRERLDQAIDYVNTEGGEGINFAAERGVEKDVSPATDETLKAINDAMLPRDGTWDTFLPYLSKRFKRPITEANQLTEAEAKTALSLLTTQTTKAAA
ncbi:recombinase RecT [Yersinia enterocolitica]|uniref:P33 n=1 Tax=Yersinia enterocolitica TaxID=630 RepID=A0A9P1PXS9_YEREN|nr:MULTISPECIES: recombinase RecT [Yersinia]EKN3715412.1 recombinase RecT [Yersinia enterocolitica]EKN3753901.1 recombinase RecT [Yersinia enterocolitica]EKN3794809.1 recombinase RecT [Yersinia enterocolitica]EKN3876010.1 recombinase RecT [Yersinia enterocolitica]EKN4173538.1 recombinase RecT [Yersinia enterocolitica]